MAHCKDKYYFVKQLFVRECICRVEMYIVSFMPALEIHIDCTSYCTSTKAFSQYSPFLSPFQSVRCSNYLVSNSSRACMLFTIFYLTSLIRETISHLGFSIMPFSSQKNEFLFSQDIQKSLYKLMNIGLNRWFELQLIQSCPCDSGQVIQVVIQSEAHDNAFDWLLVCGQLLFFAQGWVSV